MLTMMPECNDVIAGSAVPLQRDQWHRPTAGWFNLVPKEIDVSFYNQEKNKENLKVCLSR